ncbi:MAG: hypothetical protein V1707_00850 [bacterium]
MLPQQLNDLAHQMIATCPACGTKHPIGQVTLVEEKRQSLLAHMTCQRCGAALLARVTFLPHGLLGNAMVTDLASYEVGAFKDGPPMTVDHVLEIHNLDSVQWKQFINTKLN